MNVSPKTGRDMLVLEAGLADWLSHRFGSQIESVTMAAPKEGLSNETVLLDASFIGGGRKSLVFRLPPPDDGLFPEYALEKQGAVQAILHRYGIPTAEPIAFEADSKWVGVPFLAMARIGGQPTDENPSYADAGWLFEMSAADQREVLHNFMAQMAEMHRLDWQAAGLHIAARVALSSTHLADEFGWWLNYLKWIQGPQGDLGEVRELEAVFAWLRDNWPDPMPPDSFVWGDARTGNMLWEGKRIVGVLDFENMTIAPAETDFGWWMAFRKTMFTSEGRVLPELPGYLDTADSVKAYSEALGRPLQHVRWFEIFGAARIGACSYGVQKTLRQRNLVSKTIIFPPLVTEWVYSAMRGEDW